mgnify:CR=1 FL=1
MTPAFLRHCGPPVQRAACWQTILEGVAETDSARRLPPGKSQSADAMQICWRFDALSGRTWGDRSGEPERRALALPVHRQGCHPGQPLTVERGRLASIKDRCGNIRREMRDAEQHHIIVAAAAPIRATAFARTAMLRVRE